MSGNLALVVAHAGDYPLRAPLTEFFGLPSPALSLSDGVCTYLTATVISLSKQQVSVGVNEQRGKLTATLHVTRVTHPVVIGYALGYNRMGPVVVGLESHASLPCVRLADGA